MVQLRVGASSIDLGSLGVEERESSQSRYKREYKKNEDIIVGQLFRAPSPPAPLPSFHLSSSLSLMSPTVPAVEHSHRGTGAKGACVSACLSVCLSVWAVLCLPVLHTLRSLSLFLSLSVSLSLCFSLSIYKVLLPPRASNNSGTLLSLCDVYLCLSVLIADVTMVTVGCNPVGPGGTGVLCR